MCGYVYMFPVDIFQILYTSPLLCKQLFLRPPCLADANIIFLCCCFFFIAALWNRAGHYIFDLWFLLLLSSSIFFPCLISAFAHWMSVILPHMVWTQKIAKNSPPAHHRTTLSGYIFVTTSRIDSRK